ncbi:MAG: glycoside hydrolase family 125 protein [Bacilli bacterium]
MKRKRYFSKISLLLLNFFILLSCQPPHSSSHDSSNPSSSECSSASSGDSSSSEEDPSIYQIANGNFETGDLSGWELIQGDAFSNSDIVDFHQVHPDVPYNKDGTYFYFSQNESAEGILHSAAFIVGGSGIITFKLGGAYLQALTYISFIDALTEVELYRVGNQLFNVPSTDHPAYRVENMNDYYVDLSCLLGREIKIALVDCSTANYGYLVVDHFVTYYESRPDLTGFTKAEDIKPVFNDYAGTPTALYNGDFRHGLSGYTVIGEDGVFQESHINAAKRLSNRPDETKIGVLRSSAFKVTSQRFASLRLGATKHRELTYVSLKVVGTNQEVFRFFSDRWKEADEEATHLYYLDLIPYQNRALYLEFVDNSRGDWGLLSLEQIITDLENTPAISDEVAFNLLGLTTADYTFQAMRGYVNPLIEGISDETTRITVQKTFYATLDGIANSQGSWPSVIQTNQRNGTTFIITGDIDAMWLRDSSAQVLPYLQFMKIDSDVQLLVRGLLLRQFELLRRNQYANAFKADGSVFELKYEIDSLIYPLWLAEKYYRITQDATIFDSFFQITLDKVLTTLQNERDHRDENYMITGRDRDFGPHEVNTESGLIWSGYRPSDDVTYYKFFIPGNMFAVATLEKIAVLLNEINRFPEARNLATTLACEVRAAIETYATYQHPTYGKIYAFEVDGFSHDLHSAQGKLLMDAANIPSLLSIPWLGYAEKDDQTYLNTRAFILSQDNPYYYEGTYAKGIGDPHDMIGGTNPHPDTPVPWHMALAMQGLTTDNQSEIETMIAYMTATTAGTYVMHEAFNANDPSEYTRDWFTWPCALYAHLYLTKILNINLLEERL